MDTSILTNFNYLPIVPEDFDLKQIPVQLTFDPNLLTNGNYDTINNNESGQIIRLNGYLKDDFRFNPLRCPPRTSYINDRFKTIQTLDKDITRLQNEDMPIFSTKIIRTKNHFQYLLNTSILSNLNTKNITIPLFFFQTSSDFEILMSKYNVLFGINFYKYFTILQIINQLESCNMQALDVYNAITENLRDINFINLPRIMNEYKRSLNLRDLIGLYKNLNINIIIMHFGVMHMYIKDDSFPYCIFQFFTSYYINYVTMITAKDMPELCN